MLNFENDLLGKSFSKTEVDLLIFGTVFSIYIFFPDAYICNCAGFFVLEDDPCPTRSWINHCRGF